MEPPLTTAERRRLQDLLIKTSRTFALAIPELPRPTVDEVTVAYLLFRIADTFEDATVLWNRDQRLGALADLESLLRYPTAERAGELARGWTTDRPIDHDGYVELLGQMPLVLRAWMELEPDARAEVGRHTVRTSRGMAAFVERAGDDGVLRLDDLDDLRAYCYVVAGIVGEMLTELFLLRTPSLTPVAEDLRARASKFGEGLQLVNILKDSDWDRDEGRQFLPGDLERNQVFRLAREDLDEAAVYARMAQENGAPAGVLAFISVPVALARAALDKTESKGPGAKISRPEVLRLYHRVRKDISSGRPVLRR